MTNLSIVIPAFNSEKTLPRLLISIRESSNVNFRELEIIIVDDKSTDGTVTALKTILSKTAKKNFPKTKIITLKDNSGPAKARNIGVKYSHGKNVLFLDADVLLYKNTLFEVINSFKHDKDLFALTGVWSKEQKSRKFFPKFKALRDWSYWINERDPKNYYYLFSTRIAAINRGLFLRLGGFDTTYKAALVEDIELTYRIVKRYAVVFNPKVKVRHEFEDFLPIAKKYFWRSFYWSKIYRERKKFDPVATTSKEALTTISAGMVVIFGALSLLNRLFFPLFLLFLLIHLWGVRKFLLFTAREEGTGFAIKSFFTGLILYLIILAGAAYAEVKAR